MPAEETQRPAVDAADVGNKALRYIYRELLRIEGHWTDQVQNQQRRINAVLAVNGFLLAFLATAGFSFSATLPKHWYFYPFLASLAFLSVALIFGVGVLWPRIKIAPTPDSPASSQSLRAWFKKNFRFKEPTKEEMPLWLNAEAIWKKFEGSRYVLEEELLIQLGRSAAENAGGNLDHSVALKRRRVMMNWQIGMIIFSLALLIAALVGLGVQLAGG